MEKNLQKKIRCSYLLLIVIMLFSYAGFAQTNGVTGKIIGSDDGQPLPGVSIKLKDKQTSTVLGADGSYTIAAKAGDVLIFTYLGYAPQQIYVGSNQVVNVTMVPTTSNLNGLLIIG